MTLEEIEAFADAYIILIKQNEETNWETIRTAFIDGAKSAVLGGIEWKSKQKML